MKDAVDFVTATLRPNAKVEALSVREVIEASSIEDAISLGKVRRLGFEDITKGGDLLLVAPGDLKGIAEGDLQWLRCFSTCLLRGSLLHAVSAASEGSTDSTGNGAGAWMHFSGTLNVVLLAVVVGLVPTWGNGSVIKRLRSAFASYRQTHRQGLLDSVRVSYCATVMFNVIILVCRR